MQNREHNSGSTEGAGVDVSSIDTKLDMLYYDLLPPQLRWYAQNYKFATVAMLLSRNQLHWENEFRKAYNHCDWLTSKEPPPCGIKIRIVKPYATFKIS